MKTVLGSSPQTTRPSSSRLVASVRKAWFESAWTSATEQVCAAGLLPRPREELAPFGARVEVMRVGGKQCPRSRYSTGTVTGHQWIFVDRRWRVAVAHDPPTGMYLSIVPLPHEVHLVGGPGRPFSSMTPTEIEELHEQRRKERRNSYPASGLTDPSLPRKDEPHAPMPTG